MYHFKCMGQKAPNNSEVQMSLQKYGSKNTELFYVTLASAQNLEVGSRFVVNLWNPLLVLTRTRQWSLEEAGTHHRIPVPILVLSSQNGLMTWDTKTQHM